MLDLARNAEQDPHARLRSRDHKSIRLQILEVHKLPLAHLHVPLYVLLLRRILHFFLAFVLELAELTLSVLQQRLFVNHLVSEGAVGFETGKNVRNTWIW